VQEERGWGGIAESGRAGEEGFASPVQDCLEIEPGGCLFAGRDRPGIRGMRLCHREGGSKSGGEGLRVNIFHDDPLITDVLFSCGGVKK
jgi:hypothetical protein